jgi:predicted ArsR family transcriptional regulator
MKSTRDQILQTLLNHPKATVNELSEAVGIIGISVRHHINALLAEGLIVAEEIRHGVGRPRQVYSLSESGLERFPTRYLRLTSRLLDQIKENLPAPLVNTLFQAMASEIAAGSAARVKELPVEQKLDAIKELLAQEGFSVEWEETSDGYHIHEITCPYYHIGQTHPEVCAVDQTLISTVLSTPVEKTNCVLHGDSHCTYIIPKTTNPENTL